MTTQTPDPTETLARKIVEALESAAIPKPHMPFMPIILPLIRDHDRDRDVVHPYHEACPECLATREWLRKRADKAEAALAEKAQEVERLTRALDSAGKACVELGGMAGKAEAERDALRLEVERLGRENDKLLAYSSIRKRLQEERDALRISLDALRLTLQVEREDRVLAGEEIERLTCKLDAAMGLLAEVLADLTAGRRPNLLDLAALLAPRPEPQGERHDIGCDRVVNGDQGGRCTCHAQTVRPAEPQTAAQRDAIMDAGDSHHGGYGHECSERCPVGRQAIGTPAPSEGLCIACGNPEAARGHQADTFTHLFIASPVRPAETPETLTLPPEKELEETHDTWCEEAFKAAALLNRALAYIEHTAAEPQTQLGRDIRGFLLDAGLPAPAPERAPADVMSKSRLKREAIQRGEPYPPPPDPVAAPAKCRHCGHTDRQHGAPRLVGPGPLWRACTECRCNTFDPAPPADKPKEQP